MHPSATDRLQSLPELSRTTSTSPSNNSIAASDPASVLPEPRCQDPWTSSFPVMSTIIVAWAMNVKAHIRQHATSCCTGELCGASEGENIPGEIIIKTGSIVGDNVTDIELLPVSTFENAPLVGFEVNGSNERESWIAPHQIRRTTRWNSIPDDPVDEVSLKGSSFYCSSEDDDERKTTK